jgi:hypothetical protein
MTVEVSSSLRALDQARDQGFVLGNLPELGGWASRAALLPAGRSEHFVPRCCDVTSLPQ